MDPQSTLKLVCLVPSMTTIDFGGGGGGDCSREDGIAVGLGEAAVGVEVDTRVPAGDCAPASNELDGACVRARV